MLISHKKKFIFIHIYKNAGTSITAALKPFAESKWQRRINRISSINRVMRKLNIVHFDVQPYASHIKASELINKMEKGAFETFFSFAIVRNPWDWQVSLYKYMLKEPTHFQHELVKNFGSFEKYIEWRVAEEVRFQKDFVYSEDGERLVDFTGKFETIEADFQIICSHIGISTSLPKLNVSNTKPYQQYYNEKTKKLVMQAFEPDISLFEYEF